jgi:hypothetical protein
MPFEHSLDSSSLAKSSLITVQVGTRPAYEEFQVPKEDICARSKFFKSAMEHCSNATTRVVRLSHVDPETFNTYRDFVYKKGTPINERILQGNLTREHFDLIQTEFERIAKLYVLSKYLQDVFAMNQTMGMFFDLEKHASVVLTYGEIGPLLAAINIIYGELGEGSKAHQAMVYFASKYHSTAFEQIDAHEDFLRDALVDAYRRYQESLNIHVDLTMEPWNYLAALCNHTPQGGLEVLEADKDFLHGTLPHARRLLEQNHVRAPRLAFYTFLEPW